MSRVPKEKSVVLKSLDTMSVGDLEAVRRKAQALIEQKLLDRKQQAIDELRSVAAKYGFDLEDLVKSRIQQQSSQHDLKKPNIYYVHPDNPDLTWTGRGRRPKWFQELLARGIVPRKNENND